MQMEKLLNGNIDSHFFCDETPIGGQNGISTSFLIKFSKNISQRSTFWIACNSDRPPKEPLAKGN